MVYLDERRPNVPRGMRRIGKRYFDEKLQIVILSSGFVFPGYTRD